VGGDRRRRQQAVRLHAVLPGPGLGGHCIPIDPLYLSWKLKTLNYRARFIELAGEINSAMPEYVLERITDALNDRRRAYAAAASWCSV
jgi:UDP-N-acetyl-D-mannosaminuronate dehydrogenase